jgi:hypothetical protein
MEFINSTTAGDEFEARFGPQVYFLATLEDGWRFSVRSSRELRNQLKRQDLAVPQWDFAAAVAKIFTKP